MKIFISTDMEGVSGVVSWNEMSKNTLYCDLLNEELKMIIGNISNSDLNSKIDEIVICDSHSRGENIPFGKIDDERVSWIRGYPRPMYMMQGLDSSFDMVMFIGYHAMVGSYRGGMDHSYSSSCIYNIRLNGRSVGETEINTYYAGYFGVPVTLISGDDVFETQVKDFFGKEFPFIRTKNGIGRYSAQTFNMERIKKAYSKEISKMIENIDSFKAFHPDSINELQVDLVNTVIADGVSFVPGLERISGRTVKYVSDNYLDLFKMILTIASLGGRFSDYI